MFFKNLLGLDKESAINISIIGGSNSVMRRGYTKYLKSDLTQAIDQATTLKYYALGGVPNIFGVIQEERHDVAANSDIIFFEYCANDRYAKDDNQYDLDLSANSLEGFVRKVQQSNPRCLIVLLLFGTNLEEFYNAPCLFSELYKSIGKEYNLPVIDITELLVKEQDLDYAKSLFDGKDHAHYTRPHGVQKVSQTIVNELGNLGVLKKIRSTIKTSAIPERLPVYSDNFEKLKYLDRFESGAYFASNPKTSVYQNTVFREKTFTIFPDNTLRFLLKGRLMIIFIKSDANDGFIKIEFNSQTIVTSSYNSWVHKIKPQNVINLMALPMRKFEPSTDFAPVSISVCSEYPDEFELGYNKVVPLKENPEKWKLSIIGIAYLGEIKPIK